MYVCVCEGRTCYFFHLSTSTRLLSEKATPDTVTFTYVLLENEATFCPVKNLDVVS